LPNVDRKGCFVIAWLLVRLAAKIRQARNGLASLSEAAGAGPGGPARGRSGVCRFCGRARVKRARP